MSAETFLVLIIISALNCETANRVWLLFCQYIDKWYKSSDQPSFQMARRLIREEGLLCGMYELVQCNTVFPNKFSGSMSLT